MLPISLSRNNNPGEIYGMVFDLSVTSLGRGNVGKFGNFAPNAEFDELE